MKLAFPAIDDLDDLHVTDFDLVVDELLPNGDYISTWLFYGEDEDGAVWRWMEQQCYTPATDKWDRDPFNVERVS